MIYIVVKKDKELSESDSQLLNRLMGALDIKEYKVINIKFFRLEDKNSFHICMGESAYHAAKQFVSQQDKLVKVSDVEQLYDLPRNNKSREETYNTLKNLNFFIKLDNKFNPNTILSSLNSTNLINLKDELLSNNITGFTALDIQGKKIRIHLDKKDISEEDINISIEELITLKLISEVFNINNSIVINKKEK